MLLSDKSPVTEATAEEHIVHSNLLSAKEKTTSYVNGYCDDKYTVSRVNVPVHHDLYQNVLPRAKKRAGPKTNILRHTSRYYY